MCGISGVYNFENPKNVDESMLKAMRDSLTHRGPDDAGLYISPDKKVGLASRRLKIIDLSAAGHMPMAAEYPDRKHKAWIVYNGEIYNFLELKAELEKIGHQFYSKTDTEVILKSYLEWGPDCLQKFNGMFAFVIWDEKKQMLFGARDHIGIKPFYYSIQNGVFCFGSEIKAILKHPAFKKELDSEGLSFYLSFGSTPAPYTLFKNILKLPPAHYFLIQNGQVTVQEYWNPLKTKLEIPKLKPVELEKFYQEKILELLNDSIRRQMISDVPFGCFLSGGIDSSTNAVLMSQALGHPVQTFSVGYHLEKYNELQWSQRIANLIGTKPNEIILTEKELLEFIETSSYFLDDLNSDYISFPVFYLSKFTRQKGVIVIQIGEGSDEIFAGYQTYLNAFKLYNLFWQKLVRLPAFLRKAVWGAAENFSACRLSVYQRYLERLAKKQSPFWGLAEAFPEYQKRRLLTSEFQKKLPANLIHEQFVQKIYKQIKTIDPEADFLKQLTYLELKHRLPELLLARADKMTMAHSVEGRVPFLDKRLVELSFTIPSWLKFKQNQPKYILKKTVEKILPPEIVWRTKQGFSAPMNEWLKPHTPTGHYLSQKIFNSKLKELNILNYDYVHDLIRANCYHDNGHIFRIWNLIMLSVWYDYWFG